MTGKVIRILMPILFGVCFHYLDVNYDNGIVLTTLYSIGIIVILYLIVTTFLTRYNVVLKDSYSVYTLLNKIMDIDKTVSPNEKLIGYTIPTVENLSIEVRRSNENVYISITLDLGGSYFTTVKAMFHNGKGKLVKSFLGETYAKKIIKHLDSAEIRGIRKG